MLHGVFSPTDFELVDMDPTVSPEDKLEIIERSSIRLIPGKFPTEYRLDLPFVWGAECYVVPKKQDSFLYMHRLNVGDERLLRHGIGTRLAQSAVRQALEIEPGVSLIHTGWCRLGALNTVIGLFGETAVQVAWDIDELYGAGTPRPLEALLVDHPAKPDEPYMVNNVRVNVNPAVVADWELPVVATSDQ